MKNDTCVVCGTRFEPREKKLYCSDKCSQYAYRQSKNKKDQNENLSENHETSVKNDVLYSFKSHEFELVKAKLKHFTPDNIVEFGFFRRNLTGIPDIDFIADYIDSFFKGQLDPPFYDENSSMYKAYKEFEKLHWEGRIMIENTVEIIPDKENITS